MKKRLLRITAVLLVITLLAAQGIIAASATVSNDEIVGDGWSIRNRTLFITKDSLKCNEEEGLNSDDYDKVDISDGVKVMPTGLSKSITYIKFPSGIKGIYEGMISDCYNLTEIKLPGGLQVIGDRAFKDCTSLKHIVIPDTVKYIGRFAFYRCVSLEIVMFPISAEICELAFADCVNLHRVYTRYCKVHKYAFGYCYRGYRCWADCLPNFQYEVYNEETGMYSYTDGFSWRSTVSGESDKSEYLDVYEIVEMGFDRNMDFPGASLSNDSLNTYGYLYLQKYGGGCNVTSPSFYTSFGAFSKGNVDDYNYYGGYFSDYDLVEHDIEKRYGWVFSPYFDRSYAESYNNEVLAGLMYDYGIYSGDEYMERNPDVYPWSSTSSNYQTPITYIKSAADFVNAILDNVPSMKFRADLYYDDIVREFNKKNVSKYQYYSGIIEGEGHKIKGITDAFLNVNDGVIVNLTLQFEDTPDDTDDKAGHVTAASPDENNRTDFGYICNVNRGQIYNCSVICDLSADNGTKNVGGICGTNTGTICGCSYTGSINATNAEKVGGIVGFNDGGMLMNAVSNAMITADSTDAVCAGGVAGQIGDGSYIVDCESHQELNASASKVYAGGISGSVNENCTISGNSSDAAINVTGDTADIGGIAGRSLSAVSADVNEYSGNIQYQCDKVNADELVGNDLGAEGSGVTYVIGDANQDGTLNILDVTTIQRHVAEFEFLTGDAFLAADVNKDGNVTIEDATRMQRYFAEFDVVLV